MMTKIEMIRALCDGKIVELRSNHYRYNVCRLEWRRNNGRDEWQMSDENIESLYPISGIISIYTESPKPKKIVWHAMMNGTNLYPSIEGDEDFTRRENSSSWKRIQILPELTVVQDEN